MEKEEGRIPPRPIEARGLLRQIFDEGKPFSRKQSLVRKPAEKAPQAFSDQTLSGTLYDLSSLSSPAIINRESQEAELEFRPCD
jgi:hypothetical protein